MGGPMAPDGHAEDVNILLQHKANKKANVSVEHVATVSKTNKTNMTLCMHYMPWFQSISSSWHWVSFLPMLWHHLNLTIFRLVFQVGLSHSPGKDFSGFWGYHWKMKTQDPENVAADGRREVASHFYPLIGPYDSGDPDVLEYHLLRSWKHADGSFVCFVFVLWYLFSPMALKLKGLFDFICVLNLRGNCNNSPKNDDLTHFAPNQNVKYVHIQKNEW